ncbi:rhodanese-like domain-containing protein [Ruminococcus albus]|uniref:Rhodanese-related sulfurtransferase n=1 Tax=Ruminococcus albus TaxID=1264 RepID=A0A1H7KU36_RUMAL|nr:rhodanese-like domain-containing protein [Ruminococcus albus]SEK89457.1 Rhodanese-related sulfurtransferase [Ruminococcus albus]
MKRLIFIFCVIILLTGCGNNVQTSENETASDEKTTVVESSSNTVSSENDSKAQGYTQISQEEAKKMMEANDSHIIVDVRRQDEYDEGHIPNAICIPNENITDTQPAELSDLDQVILVYCRSGRRSKEASQKLFDMGYTHVYEFGGIIDWTGDVAK